MSGARYSVHRLIQDLNRDQSLAKAFAANPEAIFAQYELAERERTLLRDGSSAALIELGVHPNLQMKFYRIKAGPPGPGPGMLEFYLRQLEWQG
jgi:Aromatic-ring-opening dioxygenase LigAB, LigA subunit